MSNDRQGKTDLTDQSRQRDISTADGSEVVAGSVSPGSKTMITGRSETRGIVMRLINSGETDLLLYMAEFPEDPVPGSAIVIKPGDFKQWQGNKPRNKKTFLFNPDDELDGFYLVSELSQS